MDAAGAPLAGAAVSILHGPAGRREAPAARTGADGRFELAAREGPGSYVLRVSWRDHAGRAVPARPGVPVRVVLRPGGRLAGVCRDEAGRPVTGRVTILVGDWEASERVSDEGEFLATGLPPGLAAVRLEPDARRGGGLPALSDVIVRSGQTARVELVSAAAQTVRGRVRSGDGQPAAGALVRVRSADAPPGSSLDATADAAGRFEVPGVAPGMAVLVARRGPAARPARAAGPPAPGAQAAVRPESVGPVDIEVPWGEDPEELELELAPDPSLAGVVLGRGGEDQPARPLAGALCRLAPASLGLAFAAGPPELSSARSGPDGRFVLPSVPAGEYELTLAAPGFAELVAQVLVRGGVGADEHAYTLEPACSLEGEVVLPDGGPAAGATVEVQAERSRTVRTDREGRFRVPGLEPGALRVTARGAAAAATGPASLDLHGAPGEVVRTRLVLTRPTRLSGTVREQGGGGVSGAAVTLSEPAGEQTVLTDEDGRFVAEGLGPGPFEASAFAPGYRLARLGDLGPGDEVALTLEPERLVVGTVLGPDGEPVFAFTVAPAETPEQTQSFSYGRFAVTLGPETTELIVRPPPVVHHLDSLALTAERVPAPATSGEVRVVLRQGGVATGDVVDADGAPVLGAAISLGRVLDEADALSDALVLGMSEDDGHFHAPGLPPEGSEVTLTHPDHGPLWTRLVPGGPVRLTMPRASAVEGVVFGSDGAPVAGVPLLLEGTLVVRGESGPDGAYRLGPLAPGAYTLLRLDNDARVDVRIAAAGEVRRLDLR